jgi:hypothetical protein
MTTSIQQLSLPSINGSFIQPGANLLDGMSESRVVAQAAKPKSFAPNDTEAAAIRRFTPGYAGGGAVQLVPGSSPDGRNIGKYDANTGKSTVWEGAANQQAQRLGVNSGQYLRAIAIQELSHGVVLKKNPSADARIMEVLGDAVTSAAYPQIGAMSSLANALTAYRQGATLTNLPKDSYAFIFAGVERGLQSALRQGGYTLPPGDSAVRLLGSLMQPLIRSGASYSSALKQAAQTLERQVPNFSAQRFMQTVTADINTNIQSMATRFMPQLK